MLPDASVLHRGRSPPLHRTDRIDMVVAGRRWPTPYWCSLAVAWLEQGLSIDDAIVELLQAIAGNRSFLQDLRHRAFSIYRRSAKHRRGRWSGHPIFGRGSFALPEAVV